MQHRIVTLIQTERLTDVTNKQGYDIPIMSSVGQHGIPSFCHIVPSASFTTG
jgi:hypothetical protein